MLAFFRNNQSTTFFLVVLYAGLLRFTAAMGYVSAPAEAAQLPVGALYQSLLGHIAGTAQWSALGALVLVLLQSILVNQLADTYRIMRERSWLPGVIYLLVVSSLPEYLFLSPPLVAATFVILCIRRIYSGYNAPKASALIFDAGFWLAVGSLFYPPMLWLLVAAYGGITIVRSFSSKEQAVFWVGALTPLFLGWVWAFWADKGGWFWKNQLGGFVGLVRFDFQVGLGLWLKIGLVTLLGLLVVLNYGVFFRKKLLQVQKYVSVLFWFFFVGVATLLLQPRMSLEHLLLAAMPTGTFLAMLFENIRRQGIAEILHLLLLAIVFILQFWEKIILLIP